MGIHEMHIFLFTNVNANNLAHVRRHPVQIRAPNVRTIKRDERGEGEAANKNTSLSKRVTRIGTQPDLSPLLLSQIKIYTQTQSDTH